jgi:hypothetical protein
MEGCGLGGVFSSSVITGSDWISTGFGAFVSLVSLVSFFERTTREREGADSMIQ